MKFIDMFSGIGTIRMGFEKANWECVYSIEWDKFKRQIYTIIFGKSPEGCDIRRIRSSDLPGADAWVFGSPCEDVSFAGKRKGIKEGTRSSMFFEVMRLLSETEYRNRPTWLLFENVKGLLSSNRGFDFLEVLYQVEQHGYYFEWQIINSKWFLPQHRERVFVIGHLGGGCGREILPILSDHKEDSSIPGQPIFSNNGGNTDSLKLQTIEIKRLGGLYDEPELRHQAGSIYSPDGLCPTIQALTGGYTQPLVQIGNRVRRLTPKEIMRLQGVDDKITDLLIKEGISDSQIYRSAGDGATVNVIYELAKRIKEIGGTSI